jgi:hypothetical protein
MGAITVIEETAEQAFRRTAPRKLKERGFDGDVDAEIDRLLRHGVPGFCWPEGFLERIEAELAADNAERRD